MGAEKMPDSRGRGSAARAAAAVVAVGAWLGAARAAEPGTEAASFLATDVGARAAAMGGAWTAIPEGAAGLAWNPGGLGFLERGEIAGLHLESPFGENYEYAGLVRPVGQRWGVGLSGIVIRSEDAIRDEFSTGPSFTNASYAITLGAGRRLTEGLSVGLSAKYVHERLAGVTAGAAALDAGLLWRRGAWSAGAAVLNYGTDIRFIALESPLPLRLRLGTAYAWRRLRFALDAIFATETEPGYGLGAEYAVIPALVLRGGYRVNFDGRGASGATAGAEFRLDDLAARYAYVPFSGLGASHRIEVAYAFGGRAEAPPETGPRRRLPLPLPLPPPRLLAGLGLRGTYTTTYKRTSLTNAVVLGRQAGGAGGLEYTAIGGTPRMNLSISASLTYDGWDRFEPRRVLVNARGPAPGRARYDVSAGHSIVSLTEHTFLSRQVIGMDGRLDVRGETAPAIAAPPGSLVFDRRGRAGGFSIGRWYRERGIEEQPKEGSIRAFGGQTARAVNVGDRVPFQPNTRSTFGVFEQFAYGLAGTARIHPLLDVGVRIVRVEDDPGSLFSFGTTLPQSSTTASANLRWRAPSGLTDLSFEWAWSAFDANRFGGRGEFVDGAGRLGIERRFPSRAGRRLEVIAERIGDEYEALGNPRTRTTKDRQGVRGTLEWPFRIGRSDGWTLHLDGETRDDNLGRRKAFTTTTREGRIGLGWTSAVSGWSVRTAVNARTDLSTSTTDTNLAILRTATRNEGIRVDISGPVSAWARLQAGYSRSLFLNRSILASGGRPVSSATTVWSAGLTSTPGALGGADLGVTWTGIRSLTFGPTVSQSTTDIWTVRAAYRISDRLHLSSSAQFLRGDAPTQDQDLEEITLGGRYLLSDDRAFTVEYRKFRRHFDPGSLSLDFEGYSLEGRLTTIF